MFTFSTKHNFCSTTTKVPTSSISKGRKLFEFNNAYSWDDNIAVGSFSQKANKLYKTHSESVGQMQVTQPTHCKWHKSQI